jgi:hypothetical protein
MPRNTARCQADAAVAAARSGLVMARETVRLQRMFDAAGVPAIFVKGSTLAVLAYGSLGVKESWDIDLLTTTEGTLAARRLLLQLGYELVAPAELTERQFAGFAEFHKEAIFFNRKIFVSVELHWRLTDNEQILPGINALSRTQAVPIAGRLVRTLEDEILFAYLCAHGTLHAWTRLKWLADVGALLSRRSENEIERLYRVSIDLGAGRTPAVALLLCHRILGLVLPHRLLREIRSDLVTRALVNNCVFCMLHPEGKPGFYSIPRLRQLVARLFLIRERQYVRSELRIRWTSPADRARLNLQRPWTILYHWLRLPLWLWRVTRRLITR